MQKRGEVNVKGKGMMTTFYVHPKGISDSQLISPVRQPAGIPLAQTPNLQRQTSHHGSFSAVVFGMMQATKRSTAIPGTREHPQLIDIWICLCQLYLLPCSHRHALATNSPWTPGQHLQLRASLPEVDHDQSRAAEYDTRASTFLSPEEGKCVQHRLCSISPIDISIPAELLQQFDCHTGQLHVHALVSAHRSDRDNHIQEPQRCFIAYHAHQLGLSRAPGMWIVHGTSQLPKIAVEFIFRRF